MSVKCPLCGKDKTGEQLFCSNCTTKFDNEYELRLPVSKEESERERDKYALSASVLDDKEVEEKHQYEKKREPDVDKKIKKEQVASERLYNTKSYYQLEKERKSSKIKIVLITVLIITAISIIAFYLYNKHVKENNLDRAKWEIAIRENTIDSYIAYMEESPEGVYIDQAYSKIIALREDEAEAWSKLSETDNLVEINAFLERYPQSPYERKVRDRLDSLVWQSTLKENNAQVYSEYIHMTSEGKIPGNFLGEAKKRYEMLNYSSLDGYEDIETLKETVSRFFTAISNVSHSQLSDYFTSTIQRFNNSINISNQEAIGQLLLIAAKEDVKSIRYDGQIENMSYEKLNNDTFEVNVPLQKIIEGKSGEIDQIKGYIVHLRLTPNMKIFSIYETKPYPTAP